jgi:VCBS repeat-containing protein
MTTSTGLTTSFTKTPQAGDDLFSLNEDIVFVFTADALHTNTIALDVMSNDLGGAAKTLFSIDDGNGGQLTPDADLLVRDALSHGTSAWEHTQQGDDMRIDNGKIDLDLTKYFSDHGITNGIQGLGAGDAIHEDFVYAIQLGNGTISEAHVHVDIQGMNDAAVITGSDTGSVTEDGVLKTGGHLTVTDVDHDENFFFSGTAVNGVVGSHGTYGYFLFNAETGDWGYTLDNSDPVVQALNASDHPTDVLSVFSTDGTKHDITVTINGQDSWLGPNLVVNGNFTADHPTAPYQSFTAVADWTTVQPSASLEVVVDGYQGISDGKGAWLDTQGSPGGVDLQQTVNVTAGANAVISFDLAAQKFDSWLTDPNEHVIVSWNGLQVGDYTQAALTDYNLFHGESINVVGDASGHDVLEFHSVGADTFVGMALTNIAVNEWHL